jgi:hypothetical protein
LGVTQQYIVGELSLLLAGLQPVPGELLGEAVGNLRHEVESGPLPRGVHGQRESGDVVLYSAPPNALSCSSSCGESSRGTSPRATFSLCTW